jgi:hypothetical protein
MSTGTNDSHRDQKEFFMKQGLFTSMQLMLMLVVMLIPGRAPGQIGSTFNVTNDLTANFTSEGNFFSQEASGGLNGSGAVVNSFPGIDLGSELDLWTWNVAYDPNAPELYASAYFYNASNNGYGGIGFSIARSDIPLGEGSPMCGLGMITHSGGGAFICDDVETPVSYAGNQLVDGHWYRIDFKEVHVSNSYILSYQIYNSDENGVVSQPAIVDETSGVMLTNNITGSDGLYPYFSAGGSRFHYIDNFVANDGPLPIQLASLTAAPAGGSSVKLVWKTASETNNYGFYVERSSNKSTGFVAVSGLIPGHGTSTTGFSYEYADKSVPSGNQYYRLKQVDLDNAVHYSDAVMLSTTGVAESAPVVFAMSQNYPNPFNPSTQFRFSVAKPGFTTLVVYNAIGQEVSRIFNGPTEAGKYYTARLDGTGLASGVYFARLQSGIETQMKKIVLMK